MNDRFRWDDAFSVGVDEFDGDHRHLLELGNAVYDAVTEGQEHEAVTRLLAGFEEESSRHFAREEELMRATGYPLLDDHHVKHTRLTAELHLFMQQYAAGHIDAKKLARFLIDWVVHHVVAEDKKFQAHRAQPGHSQEQGAPASANGSR